jgi:putative acetyltransferase
MDRNSSELQALQKPDIIIEGAVDQDAHEIARVFRRSFKSALPSVPTLHSEEEDRQYFSQKVLTKNEVFVARDADGQIVGFIAFDKEFIHHLYVLPNFMGRGTGGRLLNIAKAQRRKLHLWTFQKNEIAKRFYGKHGFTVIKETDGAENEENEDDVLFEWTAR